MRLTQLDPIDRELLDFLCSCAHHRVRVVVKAPRAASLQRLRQAGLVGRDDHLPSGSALLDWIARQKMKSVGALHARAAEEPPRARAADREGGGDAPKVAPPPQTRSNRSGPPTMAERARRFDEQRDKRDTQGACRTARKAPAAEESTSATRITDRAPPHPSVSVEPHELTDPPVVAPTVDEGAAVSMDPVQARPALGEARAPVDIKVNARRDPTLPPDLPLTELRDRHILSGHRHAAAVRRGHEQNAVALVDAGVNPASQNSMVSAQMRSVIRRREEEARLADPIEQAKTVIRQRGWVCFAAITSGGPKGQFYIGNRLVTEAQLLAFAENLRTTRRARAS